MAAAGRRNNRPQKPRSSAADGETTRREGRARTDGETLRNKQEANQPSDSRNKKDNRDSWKTSLQRRSGDFRVLNYWCIKKVWNENPHNWRLFQFRRKTKLFFFPLKAEFLSLFCLKCGFYSRRAFNPLNSLSGFHQRWGLEAFGRILMKYTIWIFELKNFIWEGRNCLWWSQPENDPGSRRCL